MRAQAAGLPYIAGEAGVKAPPRASAGAVISVETGESLGA